MAWKTIATFLVILCEYFVLINVVDQGSCKETHDIICRFKDYTISMGAASILAFFLITVFVVIRAKQPEDVLFNLTICRVKPFWLFVRLTNTILSTIVVLLLSGPVGALSGARVLSQYEDVVAIARWAWIAFLLYFVALAVAHIKTQQTGAKNISVGVIYVLTIGACVIGACMSGGGAFVHNTRIVLITVAVIVCPQAALSFAYRARSEIEMRTRGIDYIFSALGILMYVTTALPLGAIVMGNVRSEAASSACLSQANVDWAMTFLIGSLAVQTIMSVASHYKLIKYVISPYVLVVGLYDSAEAKLPRQ